jgi:diketogulonate reductase-like aldo/keto reductase
MEKCFKKGKAKAIGISNFSHAELQRLLEGADIIPAVHQLELHPWLQQKDFCEFNKKHGIHITQYSPFGNLNKIYHSEKTLGKLIEEPTLVEIGKKYGKTGAQAALAWGIAKGHSVIPKSKTESRIKQNFGGDFSMKEEDVKRIDGMDKNLRFNDSSEEFGYNFYADLDGKKN